MQPLQIKRQTLKYSRKSQKKSATALLQTWLLQAIFLRGDRAIVAWEQWCHQSDLENLDEDTYLLLPLLYQNLERHQVQHPWVGRMKGVQRLFWCKNQVALAALKRIIQSLRERQIETAILGEVALLLTIDCTQSSRLLNQLDLQVPTDDIPTAIETLQTLGWQSTTIDPLKTLQRDSALWFTQADQPTVVLHIRFSPYCAASDLMQDIWQRADWCDLSNSRVWHVTDQWLHLAVRSAIGRSPTRSSDSCLHLVDLLWLLHANQDVQDINSGTNLETNSGSSLKKIEKRLSNQQKVAVFEQLDRSQSVNSTVEPSIVVMDQQEMNRQGTDWQGIDWQSLLDTATQYHLLAPLQTTLALFPPLKMPMPDAMSAIEQASVFWPEFWTYWLYRLTGYRYRVSFKKTIDR